MRTGGWAADRTCTCPLAVSDRVALVPSWLRGTKSLADKACTRLLVVSESVGQVPSLLRGKAAGRQACTCWPGSGRVACCLRLDCQLEKQWEGGKNACTCLVALRRPSGLVPEWLWGACVIKSCVLHLAATSCACWQDGVLPVQPTCCLAVDRAASACIDQQFLYRACDGTGTF